MCFNSMFIQLKHRLENKTNKKQNLEKALQDIEKLYKTTLEK